MQEYLVKPYEDDLKALKPLIDNLKKDPSDLTIIYCRKLGDCGLLYLLFQQLLVDQFTNPPDAPDVPEFSKLTLFKESIIMNFC